ncbi:MAG: DnaD domain-containing protein [Dehalococcoidia bacterium]
MRSEGFSDKTKYLGLPVTIFSEIIEKIENITDFKILLRLIYLTQTKKGKFQFCTIDELLADRILMRTLQKTYPQSDKKEIIEKSFNQLIKLELIIKISQKSDDEKAYFLNTKFNRSVANKFSNHSIEKLEPWEGDEFVSNIFALYEQNISTLTPIIAEKLREAEENYPPDWIHEAFTEAVKNNKRNWAYISSILTKWNIQGKYSAEPSANIRQTKRI